MMTTADVDFEEDAPPLHLRYRTLEALLQEYTPENQPLDGETVMFEIDGIDPSEMFLSIYVRPPHPSRASNLQFPLIRLGLEGPAATEITVKWIEAQLHSAQNGEERLSLMYRKGAFRSLIQYLERELPGRGFEGIFLECVGNAKLRLAAERYGFIPTGLPEDLDFVKLLTRKNRPGMSALEREKPEN
jgi:hypothetical protein